MRREGSGGGEGGRGESDGWNAQSKNGIQSKFQHLRTSVQASSTLTGDESVFAAQSVPSLFFFTFIHYFFNGLILYTFSACQHLTQLVAALLPRTVQNVALLLFN